MAGSTPVTGIGILNTLAIAAGIEITRSIRYSETQRGLLDVYAPRGAIAAPVAVFFYGGGWESGERSYYRFVAVALARRGFVVVVPDYRVFPQARYPDFLTDGAKAVRWIRRNAEEFGGDPGLLFLTGHSAGAYIAAMLALDKRWLDAASLERIAGVVGLAGPYDFLPFRGKVISEIFGTAEDAGTTQPVTYARGDAAPLLLLSGTKDTIVAPENSVTLAKDIRALGGEAHARFYPHANHLSIVGSFSPLLRWAAPALSHTAGFIKARATILRPKPGSPRFFRTTPLS